MQPLETRLGRAASERGLFEHERNRVHPETGDAELEPVTDHATHLFADPRVRHVQIRLEVIEAVEVVLPDVGRVRPRLLLDTWEHDPALPVRRALPSPDVPVVEARAAVTACCRNHGCRSEV